MLTYNPERFASLYASALGQRLWDFLTQPENVARLETASELSKPAVEGIDQRRDALLIASTEQQNA